MKQNVQCCKKGTLIILNLTTALVVKKFWTLYGA
jgi:hypothetical protein